MNWTYQREFESISENQLLHFRHSPYTIIVVDAVVVVVIIVAVVIRTTSLASPYLTRTFKFKKYGVYTIKHSFDSLLVYNLFEVYGQVKNSAPDRWLMFKSNQCDQMPGLLFNIWPFTAMKICPKA